MNNKILHMPSRTPHAVPEPTFEQGLGGYDLVRLPKKMPGLLDYLRTIGTFAVKTAKEIRDAVMNVLGVGQSKPQVSAEITNIPENPDNPAKPGKLRLAA